VRLTSPGIRVRYQSVVTKTRRVSRPSSASTRVRASRLRRSYWLFALPAAIFLLLFHFAADVSGATYAFTDWNGISAGANFIGLKNFSSILSSSAGPLAHTVELAVTFVVLVNLLGLLLALGLNRVIKSRHVLRVLYFAPVVMSPLAISYVWQYVLSYQGPLNELLGAVGLGGEQRAWLGSPAFAIWAVLVVLVWQYTGLAMIIYLAGLQNIGEELEEAAVVDGAPVWMRFRRITLPLLAPAIGVAVTLTLILGLRVFDQVIALTDGGPVGATSTLATTVYQQTFVAGRFGYGAALALVLAVLVMLFIVAQHFALRLLEKAR
jgi:raffinose/stachyose/melibiose transport system permease protein